MADSRGTQAVFNAMLESKRVTKKNRMAESKKRSKAPVDSKRPMRESTIPARRKLEGEDVDVMDDVIDNIAVVTDPSKNADELEARADEIQDAIEDTPEGEEAFSDEYVGDNVYACPVCGESFFADETYHEGDACPICQAEPSNGFLNQGVVAANEPESDFTDDDFDEYVDDEESIDIDEPEEVDNDDEELEKNESRRVNRSNRRRKTEGATLDVDVNINTPSTRAEVEYLPYELDDESFNGAMDEFVKENYGKSVNSMKMVRASYNPKSDAIKIECRLMMKNGKRLPATFVMKEAKNYGNRSLMTMTESTNTFKMESKNTPAFKLSVIRAGKMLACESISYSYQTTHPKAGKVKVEGVAHGFKSANGRSRIKNESRKVNQRRARRK